jgi:hypothetical protein
METNMEMTERDESNDYPRSRERREKKELKQSIGAEQKKIDYLKKKRERYALRKRAEDVGLDQLPQGRANKSVRVAWIEELEKRERRSKEL